MVADLRASCSGGLHEEDGILGVHEVRLVVLLDSLGLEVCVPEKLEGRRTLGSVLGTSQVRWDASLVLGLEDSLALEGKVQEVPVGCAVC